MPMSKSFKDRLFPILPRLIEEFGTPFHIYDEVGIYETCMQLNAAFSSIPYRQFFAVKALPNPHILKLFRAHGFGYDCSSIPELVLARGTGAVGSDIMFTSNNTSPEEFCAASPGTGRCILNLDDVGLIDKVVTSSGSSRRFPDIICFRYNPGKRRTGNSIIGEPHKAKYGITYDQIVPAYRAAMDRGATRFGLHTMVCSNELKSSYMVQTVEMLLDITRLLLCKLGIELEFINMGGGFGIPYKPSQKPINLKFMAGKICSLMHEFKLNYGFVPGLITECGRFITGPHGVLVSKVINQKFIYERHVGVDTGMPALMRPAMYGAYHHLDILDSNGKPRKGRKKRMNVVGSICENCDRLATQRLLPANTREGDIVVTHDTGAHGAAMGFQYNGRLRPKEILLSVSDSHGPQTTARLIRREENIDDYFRTLSFTEKVVHL